MWIQKNFTGYHLNTLPCLKNKILYVSTIQTETCIIFTFRFAPSATYVATRIILFLLAGHKVYFTAPCETNKSISWPPSRKKIVCDKWKTFILIVWLLPLLCSSIELYTRKIHFFSLVAQYTIYSSLILSGPSPVNSHRIRSPFTDRSLIICWPRNNMDKKSTESI